jgi:DNA-binding response OmpR family regulator
MQICPNCQYQSDQQLYDNGAELPSGVPTSKQTIAIVEDDAGFNRALQRLLQAFGFATETFLSGEDFLASAISNPHACLILDIHLPGISGFELFERLSADGPCPPVIFTTAEEEETVREEASRISGNTCLRKPLSGAALLEAVEAQLRRRRTGPQ